MLRHALGKASVGGRTSSPTFVRMCLTRAQYSSRQISVSYWNTTPHIRRVAVLAFPTVRRWATGSEAAGLRSHRDTLQMSRYVLHSSAACAAPTIKTISDPAKVKSTSEACVTSLHPNDSAAEPDQVSSATGAAAPVDAQCTQETGSDGVRKSSSDVETTTGMASTCQPGFLGRAWCVFKSESSDFFIFYLPFYMGTFLFFYFVFSMGLVHKEKAFDYVLSWMGDRVDRTKLQARIATWDTWVNLGFAVAVNELIEVVRLPIVFLLYYITKPYSNYFARWLAGLWRRVRCVKSTDGPKS